MTQTQKIIKYCAIALAIFLIVAIFSSIIGVISFVFFAFGNTDGIVGDLMFYGIWKEDDIKNLDISIGAAALEIKNGDAFSVESNYKYLKAEVKNGTLVIEEDTPSFLKNREGAQVILTVPLEFYFNRAEIEMGGGKLTVESFYAENLRMELGAGETVFENLIVTNQAEIQTGVGKFSVLNGRISDLDFDVGIGNVSLTAEILDECEFDCGIGNTEIFLIGAKEDYTISVHTGLVSATVDGESVSNDEKIGNGAIKVEINGSMGDIRVCFNEKE